MNIHEYQGKAIFRKYGIPVPQGLPAFSPDEAAQAAERLIAETGSDVVVVKAQIHAGGRGKAGGVKVVKGAAAAREAAAKLLGSTLVTKQTGPSGKVVQRLLVEHRTAHEFDAELLEVAREPGAQVVEHDDRATLVAQLCADVRADESSAAGHEHLVAQATPPRAFSARYQAQNFSMPSASGVVQR